MSPAIRPGRDPDAGAIIRLIGDCWAEYPGCLMDVDGELPELRALASWFAAAGGALWVAEDDVGIHGMVATRPVPSADAWEICRLYVAKPARSTGLALALLDLAEGHARAAGTKALVLWTDTRFLRAHAFYEKRGYLRQGPIRVLDDISNSLEFRYAKPACGLVAQTLDPAAAASAERSLARLLRATGAGGNMQGIAALVAQGLRVLVVAWSDGEILGAVQLGLAEPGAPPHRAAMTSLLLAPDCDRARVARALLGQAEAAVAARGKALITAEWQADDAVAGTFVEQGWHPAGRIPSGLAGVGGAIVDSIIFCKALASDSVALEAPRVGR
ncbi:MAG: GNAT family N-acetyltransferase [Pseudomonadota bacterium]